MNHGLDLTRIEAGPLKTGESGPRQTEDKFTDLGALSRFYRFIYPNLAFDRQQQAECLEALIQRNRWLG